MSVRKTLINSIWFGIIPKISTLINVVLLPIITPYLTSSDLGIWGIISGYVGIFSSIASLGLYVHLTNTYYEYGKWFYKIWSRLLYLILIASSICSFVLLVILLLSLDDIPIGLRLVVSSLATFPVLLCGNVLLAQHLYPLNAEPKPLVLRNLVASLLGILSTFILIYHFRLGYIGYVCGAAINALIGFVLFIKPLWFIHRILPRPIHNSKKIIDLLKISFPAIPHALGFIFLSSSARIIMNLCNVPVSDIGLYTNGYTIGDYVSIITGAAITSLMPQFQLAYRSGNYNKFRDLYYFCQFTALIAILLFVIWMPQLYDILIHNDELKKSIHISQYSCFANAVYPFYCALSTYCFIDKRTDQLLWLVFVPGLLNVALCFLLIPFFGYKIALLTTIISYWSQMLIPFVIRFHKKKTNQWLGSLWKIFVLIGVFLLCILLSKTLSQLNIIAKLFFTLIIVFIVFLYLKYCDKKGFV